MRAALLTNFIPPYRVALFEALRNEVGELRIFVSTAMESNRQWTPDWANLDVVVQRTLTLRQTWRTPTFQEPQQLHIPYDTAIQLNRYRPDVIISAELGSRSIQAALYARATRTPFVLWGTLSDEIETQRGALRRRLRGWLIPKADTVIVNGDSGARYFARFGVPEEKLLRVNQPVKMDALVALPLEREPEREHALLYVGRLSEGKGVRRLVDAIALLAKTRPERRIDLTLVGDGPLRAEFEARTHQTNVHTKFVGNVGYHELPNWYRDAGILVFPTLADEWGLVVNEALAAGVPVLGSVYSPAVNELIQDGVNGWAFVPDRAQAIAESLDRVLDTPTPQIRHMREAARGSVRDLTEAAAAARIAGRLRELAGVSLHS
jgi:glycosyltransferase involved in cell wall biosynthesis